MDLVELAEYHRWANERTRSILEGLTVEEFMKDIIPPLSSIQQHVFHIMIAVEFNIQGRVKMIEQDFSRVYEEWGNMSIPELLDEWRRIDDSLIWFAENPDVEIGLFPNFLGEGEMKVDHTGFFFQYLLHSTYHRSQIMSALRMLGREGIGTDYLFYLSHLECLK